MSDDEAVPSFDDSAKEANYWRTKVADLQDMLREAEASLKDFAESSKELEAEMEKDLNDSAKRLEEMQRKNERLTQDKEEWKGKYQTSLLEHNKMLAETSKEISQLTESRNIYKNQLRDMELDNDELETAERMIRSSLADIESRYNQQMERTVLMEQELIEKNQLTEDNQRLRDEIRELTEEMTVLREKHYAPASTIRSGAPTPAGQASPPLADGEMSLQELTGGSRPKLSSPASSRSPSVASFHSHRETAASSRASPLPPGPPPSALRTPMAGRTSMLVRRQSRDYHHPEPREESSPSLRARQQLSASRTARLARTPIRPSMGGPSSKAAGGAQAMRMVRELNARMANVQNKVNAALTRTPARTVENSALPRPSSRMTASPSFGASTTTIRNGPRPSFDGRSSIPVSSLSKSVRRPHSRLSLIGGPGSQDTPEGRASADYADRAAATPTSYTARARNNPLAATRTADSLDSPITPSADHTLGPLDFLTSDPGRPGSRSSYASGSRDNQVKRRPSVATPSSRLATSTYRPRLSTATGTVSSASATPEPSSRPRERLSSDAALRASSGPSSESRHRSTASMSTAEVRPRGPGGSSSSGSSHRDITPRHSKLPPATAPPVPVNSSHYQETPSERVARRMAAASSNGSTAPPSVKATQWSRYTSTATTPSGARHPPSSAASASALGAGGSGSASSSRSSSRTGVHHRRRPSGSWSVHSRTPSQGSSNHDD